MNFFMWGALSGCIVIILGAFGAHALKEVLDDYSKSIFNKAVLYQMFHTLAILVLGIISKIQPELHLSLSGWSFLIGIIVFSGSLYLLSITGIKTFGAITPIGGTLFIIGWIILFFKTI